MRYFVLLKDSLREALDRKSLYVLLVISAACILFCLSVSFHPLEPKQAVQSIVERFNTISARPAPKEFWRKEYESVKFEAGAVAMTEEEGKPRYRFRVTAAPAADAHRLIRHWWGVSERKCRKEADAIPDADVPADAELQKKFLRAQFREAGLHPSELRAGGDLSWEVDIRVSGLRIISGAEEMALFFGLVTWRPRLLDRYMSSAEMSSAIEITMADTFAGFAGMLTAIVVTAGIVPTMLQKGTIDVLLSKPIARMALLVYKYLGGCCYVLLYSSFLIGGCWLTLSWRTGHWNPYFPLTILVLAFSFAVLYSVSVLMGILTRSFGVSCFVTIGFWAVCATVGRAQFFITSPDGLDAPRSVAGLVRFLYLLLPKTFDLGMLNNRLSLRGNLGDSLDGSMFAQVPPVDTTLVLGTSGLFALLMLALAGWAFAKRDY